MCLLNPSRFLRISISSIALIALVAIPADGASFVVTTELDVGPGSLRDAINQANSTFGGDVITFAPHVLRIEPLTALPSLFDITGGTRIEAEHRVVVDGNLASDQGFLISSDLNEIAGLSIIGFISSGVYIDGGNRNVVRNCWIGTDGTTPGVGNFFGVSINAGAGNRIGGPHIGDRNVISGNFNHGIVIATDGADENVIQGNYIGVDPTGMTALPNGGSGFSLDDGKNNLIGGPGAGEGNVVSGNTRYGILIADATATGNRIEGNICGLNATGSGAVPNAYHGIAVLSPDNFVGGGAPGAGNVSAGNLIDGITLSVGSNSVVAGNIVGLGVDGMTPFANGRHGVHLFTSTGVTVGGLTPGAGNTIAASVGAGIQIAEGSHNAIIRGNRIGTAVDGVTPVAGQTKGIFITSSDGTVIGGVSDAARNIIAHNVEQGIHAIAPNVSLVKIRNNSIHSNGMQGILFGVGVNPSVSAPTISMITPVTGTAPAAATIEIFVDNEDEGRVLVDTVQANGSGAFTSSVNLAFFSGLNVTATATVADGSTSVFSAPVMVDIPLPNHSADTSENGVLSLSETLRVVQLYNAGGYGCQPGTEDGYAPNDPDTNCDAHSSDYIPQDWVVTLSELLRLIQIFNAGGVRACPGEIPATEDGYCAGIA